MCRSPRLSPSTTTHYPGGLEGESKREGAGVGVVVVGGFVEEKESQMRGGGTCSYRNSYLPVSVFKSKQLRLSQKKCLVFFTGCFKGQDLNKHYGPNTLYF